MAYDDELKRNNRMKAKPYDRRGQALTKKAMASTARDVKPVAKDTNKTRRKMVKPTARNKIK